MDRARTPPAGPRPASHAEAWALVAPFRERLVTVARGRGLSFPDAQDVAHHVLCRAVERGGLDRARVEPFLVRAAAARCAELRAEAARQATVLARSAGDDRLVGDIDENVCDRAHAAWLLGRLPDRERRVVTLSAAGETVTGIAARTGLSYPTVDRLLCRARKELRRLAVPVGVVLAAAWRQRRLALPSAATAAVAVAGVTGLALRTPVPEPAAPPVRAVTEVERPVRRVPLARPAVVRPAARPVARLSAASVGAAAPVVASGDGVAGAPAPDAPRVTAWLAAEPAPRERGVPALADCLAHPVTVEVGARPGVRCAP